MNESIAKLRDMVAASDNIVFFGGAGVSTESGIPDFRSVDGLYNQNGSTRPKQYSAAHFLSATRRNTTASTGKSWLLTA